jgi:hypothetical protein
MRAPIRRTVQILARSARVKDRVWPVNVVKIAHWAPLALTPLHEIVRWKIGRTRRMDVHRRIPLLQSRMDQHDRQLDGYRVSLDQLCPNLDEICRPMRRPDEEISLAAIDQDGFLHPYFSELWPAPLVSSDAFLRRDRFDLTVVDHSGWVGVRKDFRGDQAAFANELEAGLDLAEAGCHVPPVFKADFAQLSITFAYIDGFVVREALAQAGAPLRNRDWRPARTRLGNRWLDRERRMAGRKLVEKVVGRDIAQRVGEELLAIHRAGYTMEDVKYGNIIIEAKTETPYFVDCEQALPLRHVSRAAATYLRDRDAEKLNALFGTDLLTAKRLRRRSFPGRARVRVG